MPTDLTGTKLTVQRGSSPAMPGGGVGFGVVGFECPLVSLESWAFWTGPPTEDLVVDLLIECKSCEVDVTAVTKAVSLLGHPRTSI